MSAHIARVVSSLLADCVDKVRPDLQTLEKFRDMYVGGSSSYTHARPTAAHAQHQRLNVTACDL